jgi:hypothetical protein
VDLAAKLRALPESIKLAEEQTYQVASDLAAAQSSMRLAEMDVATLVAAEKDANGKAVYSNETTRAAEVLKRKQVDSQYQAAEKVYANLMERNQTARAELTHLTNQFSAMRHLADLYSGWMRTQGS